MKKPQHHEKKEKSTARILCNFEIIYELLYKRNMTHIILSQIYMKYIWNQSKLQFFFNLFYCNILY